MYGRDFEPVDIGVLTAELASNFHSAMEKAGLRLAINCPSLPQAVYVDRDMWEKIVLNLMSNAFKFTFKGEVTVETQLSHDHSGAEITVGDTGTGIPPDEVPHLFERLPPCRVAGARSRGAALALLWVQELVKLHGGASRQSQSQVGRGSRFTVVIPFGTAHLPKERIRQAQMRSTTNVRAQAYIDEALGWLSDSVSDSEKPPPPSSSEDVGNVAPVAPAESPLVLLVDDNIDMRNYVHRLLTERYIVDPVGGDGGAALEAARRRRPDLILSDVMMPRLDGFGLIRSLRRDSDMRDVPVIFLSARAGEEASVEGLDAGAADYLAKPFSARELLARVRANLDLAACSGRPRV